MLLSTPFPVLPMVSEGTGFEVEPLLLPSNPTLIGAELHAQSIWVSTSCAPSPFGLSSSSLLSFTIGG